MSFWTSDYAATGVNNPKRSFRFKVQFSNNTSFSGAADLATTDVYWAKTATKPGFTVGSVEHSYLSHTFKFPGRITWSDVTITMVDPGGAQGVGYVLASMLNKAGYVLPASNVYNTISKETAVASIGGSNSVVITQMDAAGNAVEQWTLYNAFIADTSFGSLDYGNEDLTEYSITIKYDWAQLTTDGGEVDFTTAAS